MKAVIEKGRVSLPKEIFEKGYLPDNGEIEVEVIDQKLRFLPLVEPPLGILKSLEEPPQVVSIDKMVKAEAPDVD